MKTKFNYLDPVGRECDPWKDGFAPIGEAYQLRVWFGWYWQP